MHEAEEGGDGEQTGMSRRRIHIREEITVKKKKYSAPSPSKRDCHQAFNKSL